MDANQIEKLKALALAAGDWTPPEPWEDDRNYRDREIRGLEFCAAANPAAVLELCNERDQFKQERDELRAEVERLRARFDYIEDHATTSGGGNGFEVKFFVPIDEENIGCGIDAAIAAHTKAGKDNA